MLSISDLTKLSTDDLTTHIRALDDSELIALALVVAEIQIIGARHLTLLETITRTLAARFQARVFGPAAGVTT